jgi:hypothetical protein
MAPTVHIAHACVSVSTEAVEMQNLKDSSSNAAPHNRQVRDLEGGGGDVVDS